MFLSDSRMMAAEHECIYRPAQFSALSKPQDCCAEQLVHLCQHGLWAEAFREVYTSSVWTQLPKGTAQGRDQSFAAANTLFLNNSLQTLAQCDAVPARLFDELFTAVPEMRVSANMCTQRYLPLLPYDLLGNGSCSAYLPYHLIQASCW